MGYSTVFENLTSLARPKVYERFSDFGGLGKYFPSAIDYCTLDGSGIGSVRTIKMFDLDGLILERLELLIEGSVISYSIVNESPLPFDLYHSVIRLSDHDGGCHISWSSNWRSKGDPEDQVRETVLGFYRSIFEGVVSAR